MLIRSATSLYISTTTDENNLGESKFGEQNGEHLEDFRI